MPSSSEAADIFLSSQQMHSPNLHETLRFISSSQEISLSRNKSLKFCLLISLFLDLGSCYSVASKGSNVGCVRWLIAEVVLHFLISLMKRRRPPLEGYSPRGRRESDTTERLSTAQRYRVNLSIIFSPELW